MLKSIKTNKGQAVMGEYVLTFFLVIGVMTAMTIFLKRAVQARIRDSRQYMDTVVLSETAGVYVARNYQQQYEPYYLNTVGMVSRNSTSRKVLSASLAGVLPTCSACQSLPPLRRASYTEGLSP